MGARRVARSHRVNAGGRKSKSPTCVSRSPLPASMLTPHAADTSAHAVACLPPLHERGKDPAERDIIATEPRSAIPLAYAAQCMRPTLLLLVLTAGACHTLNRAQEKAAPSHVGCSIATPVAAGLVLPHSIAARHPPRRWPAPGGCSSKGVGHRTFSGRLSIRQRHHLRPWLTCRVALTWRQSAGAAATGPAATAAATCARRQCGVPSARTYTASDVRKRW